MKVTEDSYRIAAANHVLSAQSLLEARQYPLANYLAGLSVECMLRAYSSYRNAGFDARHDLRLRYEKSDLDAIVSANQRAEVSVALGVVFAQWNNSQRYYSAALYRSEIKQELLNRGIKGDPAKEVTRRTVDAALVIVVIGEAQWMNFLKKLGRS